MSKLFCIGRKEHQPKTEAITRKSVHGKCHTKDKIIINTPISPQRPCYNASLNCDKLFITTQSSTSWLYTYNLLLIHIIFCVTTCRLSIQPILLGSVCVCVCALEITRTSLCITASLWHSQPWAAVTHLKIRTGVNYPQDKSRIIGRSRASVVKCVRAKGKSLASHGSAAGTSPYTPTSICRHGVYTEEWDKQTHTHIRRHTHTHLHT